MLVLVDMHGNFPGEIAAVGGMGRGETCLQQNQALAIKLGVLPLVLEQSCRLLLSLSRSL